MRIALGMATLSLALLTACGGTQAEKVTTPTSSSSTHTMQTPPAMEETEASEPEPEIAKVGYDEWFEYEDGLQVQVTKLTKFTLGEYSYAGDPGDPGIVVTVTIKNGTKKSFDTSLVDVLVSVGPNGDQADREYDEYGFEGNISKGRTKTAKYDFAAPNKHLDQILVEIVPSWDHSSCFFEGRAR